MQRNILQPHRMAIMKEYGKQPTGLDKQEWQGYTSTSGQRLPRVSRRQLYGQQCIHMWWNHLVSYGYHSTPSICSVTIFIETFSPLSMYFECVYAYKTGSQSEVNSFFGWTDFTIYSSCLLFCIISYFLQSTYIIYTKKNAPPKKKLRASADRHGKNKNTPWFYWQWQRTVLFASKSPVGRSGHKPTP